MNFALKVIVTGLVAVAVQIGLLFILTAGAAPLSGAFAQELFARWTIMALFANSSAGRCRSSSTD